jgi:ribosomal protein S15P/S13E
MKKHKTHILKLDDHDEEKERDFEISWLLSLTVQQRFQLLEAKRKELKDLLEKNGHRRPDQVIKRI